MNRCTSTMRAASSLRYTNSYSEPDKKEFIRISQAIGIGFLIMGPSSIARPLKVCNLLIPLPGVIGYIVKLVHIPVNNILVGGS